MILRIRLIAHQLLNSGASQVQRKQPQTRRDSGEFAVDVPVHRGGSMDKFNNLKPTWRRATIGTTDCVASTTKIDIHFPRVLFSQPRHKSNTADLSEPSPPLPLPPARQVKDLTGAAGNFSRFVSEHICERAYYGCSRISFISSAIFACLSILSHLLASHGKLRAIDIIALAT